jgi:hypothetical protein
MLSKFSLITAPHTNSDTNKFHRRENIPTHPYKASSKQEKSQIAMAEQQNIPTFKLVLVGDGGTGKVCCSRPLFL